MTDDEVEEKEEEADDAFEDAEEEMSDIEDEIGESGDGGLLSQLNQKAQNYGEANAANHEEVGFEDRDETTDQAMGFVDRLFSGIGHALLEARDEVYVNEYILLRFNSHDFSAEDRYTYDNNQVEYIIYGLESSSANHYAAMTEIFAVRFAINFTDALLRPTNKVFGPFFWAAVAKDAFAATISNMEQIKQGNSVVLFPRVRALGSMDYKDHLRLFLFVHPEAHKFHRLMAVLDHEANVDLNETSTYVTAHSTASIRLWFLPQLADMLGRAEIIEGRVEGNRFFIEKEKHFSY